MEVQDLIQDFLLERGKIKNRSCEAHWGCGGMLLQDILKFKLNLNLAECKLYLTYMIYNFGKVTLARFVSRVDASITER